MIQIYVLIQNFIFSLDAKSLCEKEYATPPAKETSILNEERVSNSDYYCDVLSLNCYENLKGNDCYEEKSIYELPCNLKTTSKGNR